MKKQKAREVKGELRASGEASLRRRRAVCHVGTWQRAEASMFPGGGVEGTSTSGGHLGRAAVSVITSKAEANKSANRGKKKHQTIKSKALFTSFIGGSAVHVFVSGSYFSPELRVCLFSSWPPNTNKNPSEKIKGDTQGS